MSERRTENRGGSDRRDIPRPSLRLNLLLLLAAVSLSVFAGRQRLRIDADLARVFDKASAGPSELNQITAELAEMDLTQAALDKELENRLAYIESLKSPAYYLSVDTAKKTVSLRTGNETVREASVRVGPAARKGAFTAAGLGKNVAMPNWKEIDPATRVYVF
jgi:hypothetical protein